MEYIMISKAFIVGMEKAYNEALDKGATQFTYEGKEYVTSYAKYFLEFYKPQFK
jgi:hypothetical protein